MENQPQTVTISKNAKTPEAATTPFAGRYRLSEYKKTGTEKTLVPLPITVKVSQQPDLLTVELYNESENTTTTLKYPMNGGPAWSEERQAFVLTRPVGEAIVADVIPPQTSEAPNARASFRITWQLDDQGRILENFEEFDIKGHRLESSPGHQRTLTPIS